MIITSIGNKQMVYMGNNGSNNNKNGLLERSLELLQSAIYVLVAIFLVIIAFLTFFVVGVDLFEYVSEPLKVYMLHTALNDLLLALILAELIQTVNVYVQKHELSLKLLLAAGLTALIRRVLVFGVEKIPWEEMLVTAVLIIVLVTAIILIGDRKIITKG